MRETVPIVEVNGSCAGHRLATNAAPVEVRACARIDVREPDDASGQADSRWRIERFEVSGLAPGVEVGVWIALVDGDGAAVEIEVNGAPVEISHAMRAERVAWVELARAGAPEVATRVPPSRD